MQTFNGYEISESIYESESNSIYRAVRKTDLKKVILKVAHNEEHTLVNAKRLHHEYNILKNLNIDGIVRVIEIEKQKDITALILEDHGGVTLREFLQTTQLTLLSFLQFACQLTETVRAFHHQNIIHKDIKPDNIIIHPDSLQVKITDFSIATHQSNESSNENSFDLLLGTLAYISPEQTGRMNRTLDYRTDIYSLGITFYEMLVGVRPFQYEDPMELIHSHIAKKAIPPNEISGEIPIAISNIVLKCLEKSPEERYQSAYGLLVDLETCMNQWESNNSIDLFELGKEDRLEIFLLPDKLYGREKEMSTLVHSYERMSLGQSQIVLVSGFSGIGKSTLVNEVQEYMADKRGYFITGKFEKMNRNIPYYGIIQAFRSLIRQVLAEDEDQISIWREKLEEALGNLGGVIVGVIPEVEYIIGKQEMEELSAVEAKNRFEYAFQRFLGVFIQKDHPLVLFIDDLQWSDSASLDLLRLLLMEKQNKYLLLIGSYRNNEVDESHPFMRLLDDLDQATETTIQDIVLTPLDYNLISEIIMDIFSCTENNAKALAEHIFEKTQGNPFFVKQFLSLLNGNKLITYNLQLRKWEWDINQIKNLNITDNVVDLLVEKLKKLSPDTQETLAIAAMLGRRFDLLTLSTIMNRHNTELQSSLNEVVHENLLSYKNEHYQFVHDRIQQAANSLKKEEEKKEYHLKIARILAHEKIEERIFTIVNHYNSAKDLITKQEERKKLAELNALAGKKAKLSAAYYEALTYYTNSMNLLSSTSWKEDYSFTYEIYMVKAECEYINGHFEVAEHLFNEIILHCKTNLEKVHIYKKKMILYTNRNMALETIRYGIKSLALLGVKMPRKATKLMILKKLLVVKMRFRKIDYDLTSLESIESKGNIEQEIISVYQLLYVGYYMVDKDLSIYTVLELINLSLKTKNIKNDYFQMALASFGILVNTGLLEMKYFPLIESSLQLAENQSTMIKGRTNYLFYFFVSFWKYPTREISKAIEQCIHWHIEAGDLTYSSYAIGAIALLNFRDESIDKTMNSIEKYESILKKAKDNSLWTGQMVRKKFLLQFKGIEAHELFSEPILEGDELIIANVKNPEVLLFCYQLRVLENYLLEDYAKGLAYYAKGEKGIEILSVTAFELKFFGSLVITELFEKLSEPDKKRYKKEVKQNLKALKKWARYSPENALYKVVLIEAELARLENKKEHAMFLYSRSVELAESDASDLIVGIANECAAKFCFRQGLTKQGQQFITQANSAYRRWGGELKCRQLEGKFPFLMMKNRYNLNEKTSTIGMTNSTGSFGEILDFDSVVKATQAISEEIVINRLLEKLLKTVLENAGAEKGYLISITDEKLFIDVKGVIQDKEEITVFNPPILVDEEIASSIANYVKRTKEDVILSNAYQEGLFKKDNFVIENQIKSLLCIPIIQQTKLVSILYLENNLIEGAFTPRRVKVLKLMASQSAISIENARLYANLEKSRDEIAKWNIELEDKVQERTLQLTEALEDLQKTQKQLVESEKMSSLGNLVAGVAHEINTPIGVGVTAVSYLEEEAKEFARLVEENKLKRSDLAKFLYTTNESVSMINSNLQRASELIKSFKQVAVDQSSEVRRTFNIKEYIEDTMLTLKPQLKKTKQQVIVNGLDELTLHNYPGAFSQVFSNLIMNSLIHAYEPSDEGKIEVTITEEKENIIICLSDDGKGMSEEVREKIFDPFFTTNRIGGGTGLGMNIVYNLVTQTLGGTIQCESKVGQGTRFTIVLPNSDTIQ